MKNEIENKNDGKSIFVYSQSFTDRRGHIIVGDFVDRFAYDNAISALRTAKAELEAKEKEIKRLKSMIENGLSFEDFENDVTYP